MRVAVFLSQGTAMADWERQGIATREMGMYADDAAFVAPDFSHDDPRVLTRPRWCGALLYSLLAPLIHWRTLRRCGEFRGHNGRGLWTPMIARLLFGGRYVVRFGYIWSWDMARRGVGGWRLSAALWSEWLACRLADEIIVHAAGQAEYLEAIHGVT